MPKRPPVPADRQYQDGPPCIILARNPGTGGVLCIEKDDDSGEPMVFNTRAEAIALTKTHRLLLAWAHQIVELNFTRG